MNLQIHQTSRLVFEFAVKRNRNGCATRFMERGHLHILDVNRGLEPEGRATRVPDISVAVVNQGLSELGPPKGTCSSWKGDTSTFRT